MKVQKQYVTELKWIWLVIVSRDSPEIISSPVTSDKISSEPERLLFLPYQCIESMVCPLTDIVFHTMRNMQRMGFYQCLPKVTVLFLCSNLASNELLTEQFYFHNTMPRTNLAVWVASAVFGIAGEMLRLPAYFDNPRACNNCVWGLSSLLCPFFW